MIGAPQVWGPTLATAGNGMKIGDDRRRRRPDASVLLARRLHDAGRLPEGQRRVHDRQGDRRALVPATGRELELRAAAVRPAESEHGTHVAGIAAGDHDTSAPGPAGQVQVSGIAPRAYIGNYRALTIPTAEFGLDGNSPEIAPAIEAAVARRHERDQPLARRARDHAVARHRRAGDRRAPPPRASCRSIAAGNDYDDARAAARSARPARRRRRSPPRPRRRAA